MNRVNGRTVLTADPTFYISPNGSDSNPGTQALPWATNDKVSSFLATLDTSGFNVTFQYAAGHYSSLILNKPPIGGGVITFQGNLADYTQVTFDDSAPAPAGYYKSCISISVLFITPLRFGGITLKPSNGGVGLSLNSTALNVELFGDIGFDGTVNNPYACIIFNSTGCNLSMGNTTTVAHVSGNWQDSFIDCEFPNTVYINSNFALVLISSPTFTYGAFDFSGNAQFVFFPFNVTGTSPSFCFTMSLGAVVSTFNGAVMPVDNFAQPSFVASGAQNTVTGNASFSNEKIVTPNNGDTVSVSITGNTPTDVFIIKPAGPLSSLTVNLPSNELFVAVLDGFRLSISTTQAIASFTLATLDGSQIYSAPTSLLAGQSFAMKYAYDGSWYPTT